MSHRVGRKSQLSNREYEFDNYSIDTVSCLDRWSADGLQSVSNLQVRFEAGNNEANQFDRQQRTFESCHKTRRNL